MGWEIGSVESGKSVALPTLSGLGVGSRSASYCDVAIWRQYSVLAIFGERSA